MRSRFARSMPRATLLRGLAAGLTLGVTAGLLAAPMRGRDMRASLRSRAVHTRDRALLLLEEGRRAFDRGHTATTDTSPRLTATLGEIAQMHSGAEPATFEAQS